MTSPKTFVGSIGGIGSGKTTVANIIFIMALKKIVQDNDQGKGFFILAGWSLSSIEANVLKPLTEVFGIPVIRHTNSYNILGVDIRIVYTGRNAGQDSVQGVNALGAYIDEIILAKESVVDQITSRIRVGQWRKVIFNGNPAGRNHWFNKRYIQTGVAENVTTTTYDNIDNLPADYIANLEKLHTGAAFQKNVLGEFVDGSDTILRFDNNYIDWWEENTFNVVVGMDIGFKSDPTAVVLLKINHYAREVTVLKAQRIYHADARTIAGLLTDMGLKHIPIYSDNSEHRLVTDLYNMGFSITAVNGVDKKKEYGVEYMRSYLIHLGDNKDLTDEFENYVYLDDWALPDGDDHFIDATRYAMMSNKNLIGDI